MHFSSVKDIEKIYETIENFKLDSERINFQLRAVYFDDKYTNYLAFIDFIVDKSVLTDEDRSPFEKSELEEIAEGMERHLTDMYKCRTKRRNDRSNTNSMGY